MPKVLVTILETVLVVIAVLLVGGFVFSMINSGKATASSGVDKMVNMAGNLEESTFTDIEGQTKNGSQVLNYIKTWTSSGEEVCVTVVTKSGNSTNYIYADGSLTAKSTASVADAASKSSPSYINENGKFLVTITRNNNDAINIVTFTQQ